MEKKTILDMNRDTVEGYRAKKKIPLVIVLDNIRSLNNIGRCSGHQTRFRVERLALCGITARRAVESTDGRWGETRLEWSYQPLDSRTRSGS